MDALIRRIKHAWYKEPGATLEQVRHVEEILGFPLPEDYIQFILWSNGGEGELGKMYLSLWKVEDLIETSDTYLIRHYLPDCIGIGTDGGDYGYCFDYRENRQRPTLIRVDLGALDPDAIDVLGQDFQSILELAHKGA
ncbi:MAG TPA: SMI1/KNR4 family protein [Thermomicrobiales bacterium]|jgi:hypothetical protein